MNCWRFWIFFKRASYFLYLKSAIEIDNRMLNSLKSVCTQLEIINEVFGILIIIVALTFVQRHSLLFRPRAETASPPGTGSPPAVCWGTIPTACARPVRPAAPEIRFSLHRHKPKINPKLPSRLRRRLPVILAEIYCKSSRNVPRPMRRTDRHAGETDTEDVGHSCSLFDIFERLLSVNEYMHCNVTRPVTLRAHSGWFISRRGPDMSVPAVFNVLTSITCPFLPPHPPGIIVLIFFFVWTCFQGC